MNKFVNISKILIIILFSSLIIYMINYYFFMHDAYEEKLLAKTSQIVELGSPPRGRIFDRNGIILVDNIPIKNVVFKYEKGLDLKNSAKMLFPFFTDDNPLDSEFISYYEAYYEEDDLLTKEEKTLIKERKLVKDDVLKPKILSLKDSFSSKEKILAKIYGMIASGYLYESKVLIKDATDEEINALLKANIPGVDIEIGYKRYYPYGNVLKDIFGSIGKIQEETKEYYLSHNYNLNDEVGTSYLEYYYEDYLKGTKAKYLVNNDYSLTKISDEIKGNDLYLSIDINIQLNLEKIIEDNLSLAKKMPNTNYLNDTYLILSDPNTSEIISLIGKRYLKENTFNDININTISSSYTVGSVVKGASISVGYKYNLINPNEYILDSCIKLKFQPQKCSFKPLGYINAITALKYSSNYYQFLIALHLAGQDYYPNMELNVSEEDFNKYRSMLASYGLGIKTGIDLPLETTGQKGEKISGDLLLNLAIGQYDTYTPMQIMTYINTISSSGKRRSPSLVSYIKDIHGNIIYQNNYAVQEEVDLPLENINLIKEGFKAVMESGGTGAGFIDPKYKPAGKTGTSESFLDSDNDKVIDTETISLTLASYFPYDNPKYSLVILTPHISYVGGSNDYVYFMPAKISREVTNFLDTIN